MRNTPHRRRDTWAAFVGAARQAAGLPKVELARRLGVDRATISRWEQGLNRPEDPNVVQRFADLLGLDLEAALIAAGLRPAGEPAPRQEPYMDPELLALMRMLADPDTPEATKAQIRAMLKVLVDMAEAAPRPSYRRRRRRAV